ncbi:restriction endonuclease [Paenarthrobacter nitroguajacolicus]|uniref:restriction endonuclease n=1 Tax=Paenarthrobacter nitroguajacolicus TaxID=211146 RepID=UPI000B0C64C2|nr:restriction endonuclease [Paenarthrobacter nitroguajacolicus]
MKPLPAEAYEALADALAKIHWHKNAFQRYIQFALREAPELLIGLPFQETKRIVAHELVDRLAEKERKYRDFTLSLMIEVSAINDFPDVLAVKDRPELLAAAKAAVARLARIAAPLAADNAEAERIQAEAERLRASAKARQLAAQDLATLKQEFLDLHAEQNPQKRGKSFEKLLTRLFDSYDLQPRMDYTVASDQIDGAISFDSDDYIIEAKWTASPVERSMADIFATKVARAGKNGLGLFVSTNGFSSGFKETYARSTPFITMDGVDLFAVLDGRFRLDDLLRAKKRHANETGSCFLPVGDLT